MKILNSYKNIASAALLLLSTSVLAQQDPAQNVNPDAVRDDWQKSLVTDGVYDHVKRDAVPLQWQPLRENDVMWKKRVWREIDIYQRQNLPFRYAGDELTGGGMFIEILLDAAKKGKVKAYSQFDDRFTSEMSTQQILEKLAGTSDTTEVPDPITGEIKLIVTKREFNPELVVKYRIKEDVLFDRNLGRQVTRIIGLAPVINVVNPNDPTDIRGTSVLFWLYYPELRKELVKYEVYNEQNDVSRITWDDYFEKRFFASRIIKTTNPAGELFEESFEGLYEGQAVMQDMVEREMNMWVY